MENMGMSHSGTLVSTSTLRSAGLLAGLMLAGAGSLVAQGPNPGQAADAYAAGAKANAQLMQKYTWKMRVQLTYNGDQKPASLYQMNYVNGQLQKTEISAPPEESGRKHGIKHRVTEDKMAEIKSDVQALIELTKKYMAPTPGQMFDFYSKATYGPSPAGGVQASGTNFVQPGDQVTYQVDPATKSPTAFSFTTALNGNPVTGTAQYGQVPGGPKYASALTINAPSDKLSIAVTNFDYQLSQ
jgi:hypothetical protein